MTDHLTAPSDVDSITDIKVTAAVTNTGSEAIKVLKFGTVLDNRYPTRSFTVSKDGVAADFTGIKMQIDLAGMGDSAFITIPAGESLVVEHEGKPSWQGPYSLNGFRTEFYKCVLIRLS